MVRYFELGSPLQNRWRMTPKAQGGSDSCRSRSKCVDTKGQMCDLIVTTTDSMMTQSFIMLGTCTREGVSSQLRTVRHFARPSEFILSQIVYIFTFNLNKADLSHPAAMWTLLTGSAYRWYWSTAPNLRTAMAIACHCYGACTTGYNGGVHWSLGALAEDRICHVMPFAIALRLGSTVSAPRIIYHHWVCSMSQHSLWKLEPTELI